ncbi:nucleotidyl transferase AbiEii/AbiGii toxin family protein [Pelomicrobium sp. G1]|uniref:nucleotidyl transferase AbiEii/AbiGii toxin family protein n=1 Tax=unclassified Pelomicrobium TaxID=2815318 RepID=UPI00349B87DF
MKLDAFEAVAKVLNEAGVRYLVAGGLAVNAHGYLRFTADIDLVIALDAGNVISAFSALARIGYRPTAPVTADQFTDATQRQRWIEEKGMQVLNFFSDRHRETSVDVFVYEPFDFEQEYERALAGEIAPGLPARFVSIPTLIRMKEAAGRPRDLDDIQHLRWMLEDEGKP